MKFRFHFICTLADVIFLYLVYKGYCLGTVYGMRFMIADVWFTRVFVSIMGIACILLLAIPIRSVLFTVSKLLLVYGICVPEEKTIGGTVRGIMDRFGTFIEIAAITKLIHDIFSECKKILQGAWEQENGLPDDSVLSEIANNLIVSNFTKLVKFYEKCVIKAFDYLDECILGYCYAHPDIGLYDAAKQATVLFVKHSPALVSKIVSVLITEFLLRLFFYVLTAVALFFVLSSDFITMVKCLILVKAIFFVLEDAWFEPIMLSAALLEFSKYSYSASEDDAAIDAITAAIPSFSKLFNGTKGQQRD